MKYQGEEMLQNQISNDRKKKNQKNKQPNKQTNEQKNRENRKQIIYTVWPSSMSRLFQLVSLWKRAKLAHK